MNSKFNKLVSSPEVRLKYKKQCLKSKNILFENDNLQLACKLLPFYDFYSSSNFLQMQIFIGNKTTKKLQRFMLQYRGTPNLTLYLQEKARVVPQNSQFKERVIVECKDFDKQIVLLLDFQSQVLTLQSVIIPLTLYSFFVVAPHSLSPLPLTPSYPQLLDLLSSRFQYIQQTEITTNIGIFKKGLLKDLQKHFPLLTPHTQNLLVGHFTLRDLTQDYVLTLLCTSENTLKVGLAGNKYLHFESIIANLQFVLSE